VKDFFLGLDRLVKKMPTANTIGIEDILLWSLNETSDYSMPLFLPYEIKFSLADIC
jgi:hypothetical protein